jgi:hypothetical protein
MSVKPIHTPAQRVEIARLFLEGFSAENLAIRFGTTGKTIRRIARLEGKKKK